MARLSSPALASSEIGQSGLRGTTMLSGPGQKARASACASCENSPSAKALSASGTWVMSGLKEGRPLAW